VHILSHGYDTESACDINTNDISGALSPDGSLIWIGVWRIILGIGVGGDYPMSASVTADRMSVRKRGTMLAYVFANQGWGSLVGSLVTITVLACYKNVMDVHGETSKVDGGKFNIIHLILTINLISIC
jgi:MFS transporter, PHS family, inorganic phosphate transporter